jgi:uncharacterized protein YhbP (UPF0306 family)
MNDIMLQFLRKQRLLQVATVDNEHAPWIANVYFSVTNSGEFFFVSPETTNHSKHLKDNATVAFSVAWFNEKDMGDRKAVQGKGTCSIITDPLMIGKFLANHYIYYPLWKSVITEKNMAQKIIASRPYIIKPTYMKFWSDKDFGEEGTEEYYF